MPHANSRFSRPRATSPSASDGTLPCSAVSSAASSLRCWSTRFRIRNMISVRFDSDVARQAGNAAFAPRPRRPLLLDDAKSTHLRLGRSPGRTPGPARPDVPATRRPPIQWPIAGSEVEAEPAGSASWVIEVSSCGGAGGGSLPATLLRRADRSATGARCRGAARGARGGRQIRGRAAGSGQSGSGSAEERRRAGTTAGRRLQRDRHRRPRSASAPARRDRDAPGRLQRPEDHRVPPGERDDERAHRPQGERRTGTRRPPRRANTPAGEHDDDHAMTPSVASASYACDGCDGTSGASDSHGPGPRYAVAHGPSHGTPCPPPPRTIVSLPAASARRSGQDQRVAASVRPGRRAATRPPRP